MLGYHLYLMAMKHRADIHPSGGPGPSLSLSSRPLAVVSAVCPALLALVRAEREHGDPVEEEVSQILS